MLHHMAMQHTQMEVLVTLFSIHVAQRCALSAVPVIDSLLSLHTIPRTQTADWLQIHRLELFTVLFNVHMYSRFIEMLIRLKHLTYLTYSIMKNEVDLFKYCVKLNHIAI